MKIDICSDLHFEFHRKSPVTWDMPEGGDVLVVAGDYLPYNMVTSDCTERNLTIKFFKEAAKKYKIVFVVLGNHDFWGGAYSDRALLQLEECAHRDFLRYISSKIYLLSPRDTNAINRDLNCAFIGSTLWGSWNQETDLAKLCNDFSNIENWTPETFLRMADAEKRMLFGRIADIPEGMKTIVVTHYLPSTQCITPRFLGHFLTDYFVNPCDLIMGIFSPALWIHGHTHSPSDVMINNTRVVCNPWGYSTDRDFRTSFKRIEL